MYRTGSIASRVPPAVIRIFLPRKSARCRVISLTFSIIRAVSGKRPWPESLPVSRPVSGSITKYPRSRNVATLATVAGLLHICGCMAGTKSIGAFVARIELVKRSSARPAATRARRSAVAGAMTTTSARSPNSICGTDGMFSHTSE